ncbi:hypothetical protein M1B72_17825 [Geomonas paludis]|uniref:DUF4440 domain-containing protein n=1 Tax=Geomonas paludis TaxID=2740185 RepID=A0A6V8MT00_9BACT|nr:hypothetical protein [Geomonas paludis]UPU35283.1 hypothetical protein M1B72_17825 [Geomonas paludis]GFO63172.1 hypothetical protein GMPD_10910 [Geomonas paludis]
MRVLVLLLLAISIQALCYGSDETDSAGKFWTSFRKAVLVNDQAKLLEMTSFPLDVRGVSDDIPATSYNRRDFPGIFKKILLQPQYLLVNGRLRTKTMLGLIYDKATLTKQDLATPTFFRFHQLEFEKRKGRWFLVRAYLEE